MAYNDKETPAKIFCLFHRKNECPCIEPVTDNQQLIARLQHAIRLNNILYSREHDPAKHAARQMEIENFRARLDEMSKIS